MRLDRFPNGVKPSALSLEHAKQEYPILRRESDFKLDHDVPAFFAKQTTIGENEQVVLHPRRALSSIEITPQQDEELARAVSSLAIEAISEAHPPEVIVNIIPAVPETPEPKLPFKSRYHQLYPGAGYLLPADEQERSRLTLQHDVLKHIVDGRLVVAPISLAPDACVLDSGTGCGIWLLDLAHRVPETTSLFGVDIESRLFPSPCPPNTHFSVGSCTNLPEEWTAKFDFVHQRLLIAALKEQEWRRCLSELFRVTKAGGFLQLSEAGTIRDPGPKTIQQRSMVSDLFKRRGLLRDCSKHIPDFLSEAGFEDVSVEERVIRLGKTAGKAGERAKANFIGVYRGLEAPLLKFGHFKTPREVQAFMDELEAEWDSRETELVFYFFHARRPQP